MHQPLWLILLVRDILGVGAKNQGAQTFSLDHANSEQRTPLNSSNWLLLPKTQVWPCRVTASDRTTHPSNHARAAVARVPDSTLLAPPFPTRGNAARFLELSTAAA